MPDAALGWYFFLAFMFYIVLVIAPVVFGIVCLVGYLRHKARGRPYLIIGLGAIGAGAIFFAIPFILNEIYIQQVEEDSKRPPTPESLETMRKNSVQWIGGDIEANKTKCCYIYFMLKPSSEDDGHGYVQFIRHVPGCSASSYGKKCEVQNAVHVFSFQVSKNDSDKAFDSKMNRYQFSFSDSDIEALSQGNQYDVVFNYSSNVTGADYQTTLWNQTIDVGQAKSSK